MVRIFIFYLYKYKYIYTYTRCVANHLNKSILLSTFLKSILQKYFVNNILTSYNSDIFIYTYRIRERDKNFVPRS